MQSETTTLVRGYRKGDEARQRILDAALNVFGADGFKGATTRRIAEQAGASLPALKYYFGGKEGLYLACAEEIVARYRARMLGPVGEALEAVQADGSAGQARASLKLILRVLADQLMGTEEADAWMGFVLREVAEQGPAFAILYEQVWAPGVELVAQLIARARGRPDDLPPARIEALLLISSLSAFGIARPVALKYLGWTDAGGARFAAVMRTIDEQIDRLA